ncbi:extracellular matrix regulator RemB [Brevibacillus fulvus]|uniref:DUF370 domain-containing protein n=1 Tax=Brevibacillus fulvus TaxID=1125967 RepID=A0A939BVV8_9BACL|nr:extracellular matrix/biofilm biosynthesis regulator RemA family protein [Brevibacillus fulvus]MBM7591829.1 hypothetical protein [Brevibacillus fulvus]
MFIHIGGDTVVSAKDVIAILDHQSVKASQSNLRFLEDEKKIKHVVENSLEETKSYVITKNAIYCSPISCHTLKRRAQIKNSLDQFTSVQTETEELTE